MILISVFLLSSILKAVNIYSFSQEVRMFIDAYMCDWMHCIPYQRIARLLCV